MKPSKIKNKTIEYLPIARGMTNWAMRKVKAVAYTAVAGGGAVVPLMGKIVAVANIPIIVHEMVTLAKEVPHLKGRVKALPIIAIFGKAEDLLAAANAMKDWIAEAIAKGSSLTPAMLTVTTALSAAAAGLIALTILVESFSLHSLSKQNKKFEKLLKVKGEQSAVNYVTKLQSSMKGKRRLFNAFSKKQTERISQIFNSREISAEKKSEVIQNMKKRYCHLKKTKALAIAIATLTMVGALLLCFLPTPLAPLAWSVVGLSGAFAITRMVHYLIARRKFNLMLKKTLLTQ